ncbi:hypothetical protein BLNAU_25237 [Blattamonas nauphoetae]|uniref:Uncharacterized protein n=1 Tax=Blattamonas nauphoetae TaxID=2049346 RepID=A0ABQ9WK66_9EUKA|nr:hypothetical protein BLNAU_25237 [Blattamonas nauphoetae]
MQIKQASPIQLKIGQFVSTEQQNKPFNNSLPRKIWSKVQLLKDILSEKYSNNNNLKFRKCHSLQRISKLVCMIDQCEFCTLLILPESSVEPSNIDSTLTKLTITINSAVYKPTTSTLRESQSSITHKPSACEVKDRTSHLASDIKSFTTHSGFDPNVDDRIVLDYNLENTKNCTRTYFVHVLVDYADRVALCAPHAYIPRTHHLAQRHSPDDESDMFVHGGVNSDSLQSNCSNISYVSPFSTRFPRCTPLCTRFPCCTPLLHPASPRLTPSLHPASLAPRLSALLPLLHASCTPLPLLHATRTPLPSLHVPRTRFPRPRLPAPLPLVPRPLHPALAHAPHPASLAHRLLHLRFPRPRPLHPASLAARLLHSPLPLLHATLHSASLAPSPL